MKKKPFQILGIKNYGLNAVMITVKTKYKNQPKIINLKKIEF